ncbi:MAG: PfkB family carbohydrate kinase [Chthoniobacterales bacterium]
MRLDIAGGFYREICSSPAWNEFYGSGARAAAALQNFDVERHLHTAVSQKALPWLRGLADAYDFQITHTEVPATISFRYFHPLSPPLITPPIHALRERPKLSVTGDCVLRYGMLDAEAIVDGDRVVYDPQSAFEPSRFEENGSTAKELAVVANFSEARKLTGKTDLADIGEKLSSDGAAVVVVKNGAYGATVFSKGSASKIPAYKTKRVFSIGSGDVFSAVFAYNWGVQRQSAPDAAAAASVATSFYTENGFLPLPPRSTGAEFPVIEAKPRRVSAAHVPPWDIYIAGPFFNLKQLWLIEELKRIFEDFNLNVFSPFHDVGRGAAANVATLDLEALEQSDLVFACVDELDAGTIFEIGYARSHKIPVIGFCESTGKNDLKMLEGSGCVLINDFVTAIYTAMWQLLEAKT